MLRRACIAAALLPTVLAVSVLRARSATAPARWVDVGEARGLVFHHANGMTGRRHLVEMTGAGAAWIDFDNDGDLDAFLVQGGVLDADRRLLGPRRGDLGDRLLRNDFGDGASSPQRFVDWTERSGLAGRGYGMGVATGDADGHGSPDLFVTRFGFDELWLNRGDGRFVDATAGLGRPVEGWSTSASFVDIEGDGDLDLYIGRYVDYPLADPITCYSPSSRIDYCGPAAFAAQSDRLLRNRGDGTFEDVSGPFGIDRAAEPTLGVMATDVDDDGRPEIYVANDGRPNLLWSFVGGRAADDAVLAGVAVNREGAAEAGMGIAADDFDNDGDEDLLVTHLDGETDTLYVSQGAGVFEDRTLETGLAEVSLPFTSFGAAWLDADGDGWLDLAVVSGAVRIVEEQAAAGARLPLAQPGRLLRSLEGRRFERSALLGEALERPGVGRGLAAGDFDNDGDTDLLATYNGGDARLLELAGRPAEGEWIGFRLAALDGPAPAGATVFLETAGGGRLRRVLRTDGSYCSARDPRLQVRAADVPEAVHVRFPSGRHLRLLDPPRGVYLTIREPGA